MSQSLNGLLDSKASLVTRFLERHFSERLTLQLTNQGLKPDVRALQNIPAGLDLLLRT